MNDLQIRLVHFASSIFKTLAPLKEDSLIEPAIKQIIRASSSVGANYSEAQSASSYKDFHNKIRIALKELQETDFWIHFLAETIPDISNLSELEEETQELLRILSTISKKTDLKLKQRVPSEKGHLTD